MMQDYVKNLLCINRFRYRDADNIKICIVHDLMFLE
jgi:hypothetical protein